MKTLRVFVYLLLFVGLISAVSSSKFSTVDTAAAKLQCGGRIWTDGEPLGNFQGSPVYTLLHENRIYIRFPREKPGAFENTGILSLLDTGLFPNDQVIKNCVNATDPSTYPYNYLGTHPNGVLCNGKLIADNTLIGTYIGKNGAKTFQYAVIVDGLLRINFHQEGTIRNREQLSTSLLKPTIAGDYGSFMNFALTAAEAEGCFYDLPPKYPEAILPDTPCSSGPTIQSVSTITSTSLRLQITGTGISSVRWKIINNLNQTTSSGSVNVASNVANLSYQAISPGTYTLEIEGANCVSTKSTRSFVVPLGNCADGPALAATNPVTNATQTSLQFQFHGNGVNTIKWRIKSNTTTIQSGETPQLVSPFVTITYPQIASGNYTLEIEGGSCQSAVTTAGFTVGNGNCPSGPTLSSITNITLTSLQFQFTASGVSNVSWEVINSLSQTVRSGLTNVSGNAGSLSFSALLPGTYTLRIKGGNCISTASTRTFVVTEVASRTNCTDGPSLLGINDASISSTGLSFNFHGQNVFTLDWKISQTGGTVVSQDRTTLQSAYPAITYASLPPGQYTLAIQGGSCISSVSSKPFAIGTPLPIYISDFQAASSIKGVALSWNVVSEINGERFEILRYDNPKHQPEVLGEVHLRDQPVGSYNFMDNNPLSGLNYYQLRQIDKDGTTTLSRIISTKSDHLFEAFAAPNPATHYVNMTFVSRASGTSNVEIYNFTGTKISSVPITITKGKNSHRIRVSAFPAGSYFLKMAYKEQEVNLRFIKP